MPQPGRLCRLPISFFYDGCCCCCRLFGAYATGLDLLIYLIFMALKCQLALLCVIWRLFVVLLLDLQLISVISPASYFYLFLALVVVNGLAGQFIYWLIDKHYVGYAAGCPSAHLSSSQLSSAYRFTTIARTIAIHIYLFLSNTFSNAGNLEN